MNKVPTFKKSKDMETWFSRLNGADKVSTDVIDPETGEIILEKGKQKKSLGKNPFLTGRPSRYGVPPNISDKDYGIALYDAKKFYHVVETTVKKASGMDDILVGAHDYDIEMTMPSLIKRKDGQPMDEDDEWNMKDISSAWANMANNMSLTYSYKNGKKIAQFDVAFG